MDKPSYTPYHKKIGDIFVDENIAFPDHSMSKRHFHSSIEMYFMLKGERYYFIEQDTFHVKPHMAVLIQSHQIHKTHTINHGGYHRFLLQVAPSIFELFSQVANNYSLITKPYEIVEFSEKEWEQVILTIEQLKDVMLVENESDYTMTRLVTLQLITLFARAQRRQSETSRKHSTLDRIVHANKYEIVHQIILYIQEHFAEDCSLDMIAERFYISRAYLTRVFKSITGFTVKEYLILCRIRNAKTLLQTTNLSITEIANRTGFGNITNFEKNFKNMTSMTPLQYRKQK